MATYNWRPPNFQSKWEVDLLQWLSKEDPSVNDLVEHVVQLDQYNRSDSERALEILTVRLAPEKAQQLVEGVCDQALALRMRVYRFQLIGTFIFSRVRPQWFLQDPERILACTQRDHFHLLLACRHDAAVREIGRHPRLDIESVIHDLFYDLDSASLGYWLPRTDPDHDLARRVAGRLINGYGDPVVPRALLEASTEDALRMASLLKPLLDASQTHCQTPVGRTLAAIAMVESRSAMSLSPVMSAP